MLRIVPDATFEVPPSAHTHDGFRAWATSDDFPQTGRICWLGGVIFIDLTPELINAHNRVKTTLLTALCNLADEEELGRVYCSRTLITNVRAGFSTEPDVTFASWDTLRTKRLRPVPLPDDPDDAKELEGTPDLIVEIVSPSSRKKDTQTLRRLYHRAGVPEYWLVDALGKAIDFRILLHRDDAYQESPADPEGYRRSAVLSRTFRLTRTADPLGDWRYRLEAK